MFLSFKRFIPLHICLLVFFLFSSLLLIGMHANSCPMVSTTTAQPVPPTCIATGAVWAQCQTLPSPSSLPPPQPPPPAPLVHGHVLHRPCCQTTLPTAHWVPPWCLHHESPAGRFVHLLWVDDRHISILLVYSLNTFSELFGFSLFCLPTLVESKNVVWTTNTDICISFFNRTGRSLGLMTSLWSTRYGERKTRRVQLWWTVMGVWTVIIARPLPRPQLQLHCKHQANQH